MKPRFDRLQFIAATFLKPVWLTPRMAHEWPYTRTVGIIQEIFPMFELTLDGLKQSATYIMGKKH